jgi:membrane protease subunit HflK
MERVFGGADKVIMDSSAANGAGIVPYLPLPDLRNRTQAQPTAPATTTQSGGAR